jgi:hypothetical protein
MKVLLPTIGPKLLRKKIPELSCSGPMPGERDLNFDFMLWILSAKVKESLAREGLSRGVQVKGIRIIILRRLLFP